MTSDALVTEARNISAPIPPAGKLVVWFMDMVLKRTGDRVAAIWQSLRQLRHAREWTAGGRNRGQAGAAAVTSAWSAALIRTAIRSSPGNHYHTVTRNRASAAGSALTLPGG
jgi:hypothetical protein